MTCARAGWDQIRSTSGALVGDGGGSSGPGDDAPNTEVVRRNEATGEAAGPAPKVSAFTRSTPALATSASRPAAQQSPQAALTRASDHAGENARLVATAVGSFDAAEP